MKKKIIPVLIVIALIIILSGVLVGTTLVQKYTPTKERESLSDFYGMTDENQVPVILDRSVSEEYGRMIDGSIYLSYDFIHDHINSRLYYDANEKELIYAQDTGLIITEPDSTEYRTGSSTDTAADSVDFGKVILTEADGIPYVCLDFILPYSDVICTCQTDPARVVLTTEWVDINTATVSKNSEIRHKGGIKSPILADVAAGEKVTVLEPDETWTKVMNDTGVIGYVRSKLLTDQSTETLTNENAPEESFTHILKDETIVMGWHQVTNRTANRTVSSVLSTSDGINVISPTWFYLNDNEGNISDIGSSDYVSCCHEQGIDVWGLVSNLENPDVSTTEVLTHTSSRCRAEDELIAAARNYGLDGINVDFESLESEVGDGYIEFIRELSIKCAENDLCLSVDNYVPSAYTDFYNRADQALFADYVIIMAYDEHFNGSDAGSVASLSWVTEGLNATLETVPAEQTILGIPFYTRIWEVEAKNETEYTTLSSSIYGMSAARKAAEDAGAEISWNEDAGQYYAEWTSGDSIYQVWLEDGTSIQEKLNLVTGSQLAGASFWKLGFEDSSIWSTIRSSLE